MKGLSGTTAALQAGVQGSLQAAGLAVGAGLTAAGAAATLGAPTAVQAALAGTQVAAGAASSADASPTISRLGRLDDLLMLDQRPPAMFPRLNSQWH